MFTDKANISGMITVVAILVFQNKSGTGAAVLPVGSQLPAYKRLPILRYQSYIFK